jgi:beta-lactamase regulating signal transducer with metallopeptidase domain
MLVWALGSIAVLVRAAVGATRMRHWLRRAHAVSDFRRELVGQVRHELGIERNVRLLESDDFAVPFTYGFTRPVIVLPAESASWARDRVRVILVHELTHVLRRDWIWQLIAIGACAVYWFHPGTWWLARRRRLDAELICDAQVLAFGGRRSAYARTLFEIATGFSQRRLTPAGALPFVVRSDLEHRVRTILDPRASAVPGRPSRLAPVLLVILVLTVAALRPYAEGCARPAKVAAGTRTANS